MLKRKTIGMLVALILFFCLSGCSAQSSETIISTATCKIDNMGVEFNLVPPLKRKFRSGSVGIKLAQIWETLPPYTSIQLADGRQTKVAVTLFSSDGKAFTATILGSAGGMLNARFKPEIPKSTSITNIRISSEIPLISTRVVWDDYNPL